MEFTVSLYNTLKQNLKKHPIAGILLLVYCSYLLLAGEYVPVTRITFVDSISGEPIPNVVICVWYKRTIIRPGDSGVNTAALEYHISGDDGIVEIPAKYILAPYWWPGFYYNTGVSCYHPYYGSSGLGIKPSFGEMSIDEEVKMVSLENLIFLDEEPFRLYGILSDRMHRILDSYITSVGKAGGDMVNYNDVVARYTKALELIEKEYPIETLANTQDAHRLPNRILRIRRRISELRQRTETER